MENKKQIGIWMDHSIANLMQAQDGTIQTHIIKSEVKHYDRDSGYRKNSDVIQNTEEHKQLTYYRNIIHDIKDYNEVFIFGPTTAKHELFNLIKKDHHFSNVKVEVEDTDKLTENQQHALLKKHFNLV